MFSLPCQRFLILLLSQYLLVASTFRIIMNDQKLRQKPPSWAIHSSLRLTTISRFSLPTTPPSVVSSPNLDYHLHSLLQSPASMPVPCNHRRLTFRRFSLPPSIQKVPDFEFPPLHLFSGLRPTSARARSHVVETSGCRSRPSSPHHKRHLQTYVQNYHISHCAYPCVFQCLRSSHVY